MASWAASYWWQEENGTLGRSLCTDCQTASYLEQQLPIGRFHTHEAWLPGDLVAVYDRVRVGKNRTSSASSAIPLPRPLGSGLLRDSRRLQEQTSMALLDFDVHGGRIGSASLLSTFIRKP